MKDFPLRTKKGHGKQPQFDIVSALREPLETRLAANEIQEQRNNKNKIVGSTTLLSDCKDKDIKPKLEIKSEEIGYGKKGSALINLTTANLDTSMQMEVCVKQNNKNMLKRKCNCWTCQTPMAKLKVRPCSPQLIHVLT